MQNSIGYNAIRFRKATIRSIVAIIFFVLVYLVMLSIAICIFIGLSLFAYMLLTTTTHGGVIIVALMCFLVGGYFVFILLRFLFQSNETDLSHMVELKEKDEPALFALVNEMAISVGVKPLEQIYLSADVNAAVFYNSSFFNLFFPVKKQLRIGLGLLNAVSVTELKAILAHEFAHFSQKSMRIGSYVGIVNRSIYGIFYSSLNSPIEDQLRTDNFIYTFMTIAEMAVSPMALLLEKVYLLVIRNFLALTREMEYHADQIAAETVGSAPNLSALLRMPLAQNAHDYVIQFYNNKVPECIKTETFFEQSRWIQDQIAEDNGLIFKGSLPEVKLEHYRRFDQSKLMIQNQWEDHPSMEDRIQALEKLNFASKNVNDAHSTSLFQNWAQWQLQASKVMFMGIDYKRKTTFFSTAEFEQEVRQERERAKIDPIFKGYYDVRIPTLFDLEEAIVAAENQHFPLQSYFSLESTDVILEALALETDLEAIAQIARKKTTLKSFEYDGRRYLQKESVALYHELKAKLKLEIEKIRKLDQQIFAAFHKIALQKGNAAAYKATYERFFAHIQLSQDAREIMQKLVATAAFFNEQTMNDVIEAKMIPLKKIENDFRNAIETILKYDALKTEIDSELREICQKYLFKEWQYFHDDAYDNYAIRMLSEMVTNFPKLNSLFVSVSSRAVIAFQASLLRDENIQPTAI